MAPKALSAPGALAVVVASEDVDIFLADVAVLVPGSVISNIVEISGIIHCQGQEGLPPDLIYVPLVQHRDVGIAPDQGNAVLKVIAVKIRVAYPDVWGFSGAVGHAVAGQHIDPAFPGNR